MTINPATIVAYYQMRELIFAFVNSGEGAFYQISTEQGESLCLNSNRFVWLGKQSYTSHEPLLLLKEFRRAVNNFLPILAARDFSWLSGEGQTLPAIAEKFSLQDDIQHAALYVYLKANPEMFVAKKEKFRLKTTQELQAYHAELSAKEARRQYLQAVQSFIEGQQLSDSYLDKLYSELPGLEQEKAHRDLLQLIRSSYPELKPEEAIRKVRMDCGELPLFLDPAIASAGIPIEFSPLIQRECLLDADLQPCQTEAFCIDDADSKDYDDALSLHQDKGLLRLGIHVSCVASRIEPYSRLFIEAQNRVSAFYAANMVIPLFPPQLSAGELSLIAGTLRQVVSLYLWFDESFNALRSEFRVETVAINRNYSYQEVDNNMAAEPFVTLKQICAVLKTGRDSSHRQEKPRFYYSFREVRGELQLKRIDNESPSRNIVEELMILFNSRFAAYACEHDLPVIYRNISQFGVPGDQFSASQAFLSTQGGFHPGIGASAYLHASSPIRRFTDLLNQYQMLSALQGNQLPFTIAELDAAIIPIEKRLLWLKEIAPKSERYWCLKYIEQKCLHIPLDACFCGRMQGRFRFEILPWGKQVIAELDAYPREETCKIVVYQVDFAEGTVKADLL